MVSPPPPHTPQGYLGIEARRKRDARVRALLLPIAEQLAACFGLQRTQRDDAFGTAAPDAADADVPSNLANQVDHLAALLAQRFDRLQGDLYTARGAGADGDLFAPALRQAVAQAQDKHFPRPDLALTLTMTLTLTITLTITLTLTLPSNH